MKSKIRSMKYYNDKTKVKSINTTIFKIKILYNRVIGDDADERKFDTIEVSLYDTRHCSNIMYFSAVCLS